MNEGAGGKMPHTGKVFTSLANEVTPNLKAEGGGEIFRTITGTQKLTRTP